jgi:hypothetical protein
MSGLHPLTVQIYDIHLDCPRAIVCGAYPLHSALFFQYAYKATRPDDRFQLYWTYFFRVCLESHAAFGALLVVLDVLLGMPRKSCGPSTSSCSGCAFFGMPTESRGLRSASSCTGRTSNCSKVNNMAGTDKWSSFPFLTGVICSEWTSVTLNGQYNLYHLRPVFCNAC